MAPIGFALATSSDSQALLHALALRPVGRLVGGGGIGPLRILDHPPRAALAGGSVGPAQAEGLPHKSGLRHNPACTAAMRAMAAQSRSPSPRAMAARKRSRSTPASGMGTAADSAASWTRRRSLNPNRSLKPAGSNCSLATAPP